MSRPLELTTPTHGIAVGSYWLALILGVSFLTPLNRSPAIEAFLGMLGFRGWSSSMAVCGAAALVCVVLSLTLPSPIEKRMAARHLGRDQRLHGILIVELVACAGLAFTFVVYCWALLRPDLAKLPPHAGWEPVLAAIVNTFTTKLLAATYVVGGTARVIQIYRELRRWKRSRETPRPAQPSPLAAPEP